MKPIIRNLLLGLVTLLVLVFAAIIIIFYPAISKMSKTETIPFDKSLTIVLGGGGNSGILITDSAVVVIDTKMNKAAELFATLVKQKAGTRKIIVINTHFHVDHVNGNKYYSGCPIYIGNYDIGFLQKSMKPDLMPNRFVKDSLTLALGRDTVQLVNVGQAHTTNDVVVYLKNRKLLFSGDLIVNQMNPVLNKASSANVDKWINVLDKILAKDIQTIVPGHGKLGGKELAVSLKQYFEDMKQAASDPSKAPALRAKYSSWFAVPFMAGPDQTIAYIKHND